jgi:glycosyltransferase involved in cell wall biosynthesis
LAGSDESAPAATLSAVEQGGLLVVRYLRVRRRPRRWTEEYDPAAEGLARHLLALLSPDVVHLHHWQRLTNNLVAICNDLAVPVVVTLHDVWTSCPRVHRIRWDKAFCEEAPAIAPCLTCAERGPWQGDREIASALALRRELMESELAMAAAIIAPSEAHYAFLRELHGLNGDRFIVLPHGSVPTIGSPRRKRTGPQYPKRPLQIGHWGYLMYLKGTHLVLEAIRLLRDPSAVELHLIGTASDQEYECRLRYLSQGITVRFHGAYRPEDLLGFDLDLAIFPSVTCESYSFTLDEAFHLRLPVIVSDRGALPQRIGGAGLKFRAGDAADLAKQIQGILDAPDLLVRMRRNIRPGNLVSMEAHVAMLEKIYEDAAHARKPKRKSHTPYLKLVAHAEQQVIEREEALSGLQQQFALSQARAQDLEAENGRLAQARQAAEAQRAELETRLATIAEEREEERARWQADLARLAEERARWEAAEAQRAELETRLATIAEEREAEREQFLGQLSSRENARVTQVQELERMINHLTETRDELARRLTEMERTPAARLQAFLQRWHRPKGRNR